MCYHTRILSPLCTVVVCVLRDSYLRGEQKKLIQLNLITQNINNAATQHSRKKYIVHNLNWIVLGARFAFRVQFSAGDCLEYLPIFFFFDTTSICNNSPWTDNNLLSLPRRCFFLPNIIIQINAYIRQQAHIFTILLLNCAQTPAT